MGLFLTVYFAFFLAVHLYIYRWLQPAFHWQPRASFFFLGFTIVMMLTPAAIRLLHSRDHYQAARILGFSTYWWWAIMMWIVCFGFMIEIWNPAMRILARWAPTASGLRVAPLQAIVGIAILSAVLGIRGLFEVRRVELTTVDLRTDKFPPGARPLRILHVSDIHLGMSAPQESLFRQLLAHALVSKPDMIVFTGDAIDSNPEQFGDLADALRSVETRLGKFAVLGNHDFYAGTENAVKYLNRAGFQVLRAQSQVLSHDGARSQSQAWTIPAASTCDRNRCTMRGTCHDQGQITASPSCSSTNPA